MILTAYFEGGFIIGKQAL